MFEPKSLVHAFALARLQESALNFRAISCENKDKKGDSVTESILTSLEFDEERSSGKEVCVEKLEEGSECGKATEGKNSECGKATERQGFDSLVSHDGGLDVHHKVVEVEGEKKKEEIIKNEVLKEEKKEEVKPEVVEQEIPAAIEVVQEIKEEEIKNVELKEEKKGEVAATADVKGTECLSHARQNAPVRELSVVLPISAGYSLSLSWLLKWFPRPMVKLKFLAQHDEEMDNVGNVQWVLAKAEKDRIYVVALLLCGLCYFYLVARRSKEANQGSSWLPLPLYGNSLTMTKMSTVSQKSGTASCILLGSSNLGRFFTFQEIMDATNKFDEGMLLGVGGFGRVYKGTLEDGTRVAIKRGLKVAALHRASFEFSKECFNLLL